MTQSKTRNPDEAERHQKIDEAIDASIQPSPVSAHVIADLLNEHPSFVVRRYHKRFIKSGGRWVYRHNEDSST